MCGIFGGTHTTESAARTALATFAYRGPDASGYFGNDSVSLAHARLSIIDPSERSNQPFFDARNELAIIFNGEIYNYKELRAELERENGIRFRTGSDTEMLVEGYRVWGAALLERLRGMFAFGIYDTRDQTVFLARDHAGIKPLYYSVASGELVFASELKGVVEHLRLSGHTPSLDTESLELYPVLGYVPSPRTLVQNVLKLERSSWLRYEIRTKAIDRGTWSPRTRTIDTVPDLMDAIRNSVLEHCIADVPIGTFFSGGVDSSLITAILHESGRDVETFSIRVAGRSEDEPYFKAIAETLGVQAHVASFGTEEFNGLYEDIMSWMDDPIADTSIFPTAFVARLAADRVKVVLSGEGADELFLGYPRMRELARIGRSDIDWAAGIVGRTFLALPPFSGKNRSFSALARSVGASAAYYLVETSVARDLSPSAGWNAIEARIASGSAPFYDRDWYLENMLLRKVDMATSYASIEGRVPFLGTELWNAAPRFVHENIADGRMKAILKDMLAGFVPSELVERRKSGFGTDIRSLLRDSEPLRTDYAVARAYAQGTGVLRTDASLTDRYPVYAFALVTLYRSLRNLKLI